MDTGVGSIGISRSVALKALEKVRGGASVSEAIALGRQLKGSDRGLMTQIVYGVVRHQRYLDAWMSPYRRGPLDPTVVDILRMALFQVRFLDRVPSYAAINAAVEQTKRYQPKAKNLVNAILRQALRTPPQVSSLGEQYSHPDWIIERWQARYGERLETILQRDNQIPPLTLRINLARTTREAILEDLAERGIEASGSCYLPEAVRVNGAIWLEDWKPFQDGLVTVQDESGMIVTWILDPQPGNRVCDMAAGLGGKTIHLLERSDNHIRVTALDIAESRLKLMRENLLRTGYQDSVTVVNAPAEKFAKQHFGEFDRVLLDAPCSGLGVLRRRVDARWKKSAKDIPALQEQQRVLLEGAYALVSVGGVVVYSTCSTEPEETWDVVRWFEGRHPDLVREDVTPYLPHPALEEFINQGALELAPGDLEMDGFFIARFRIGGAM